MYSVDSLQDAIESLFLDGVGEHDYTDAEVKLLLGGIDFEALLQAVRHNAQTVHAYTTQGKAPKSFNYRGADLFCQRATLLYEDFDQSWSGILTIARWNWRRERRPEIQKRRHSYLNIVLICARHRSGAARR